MLQQIYSPVDTAKEDHELFDREMVLHVCSVYPNAVAADLSASLRSAHVFDADAGCASAPDSLSQEAWVYPSNAAACCLVNCLVVPVA